MILVLNQMMMMRRGTQIQEAFRWRNKTSKSLNGWFEKWFPYRSDTLKWAETMLLGSFPIKSKTLLRMRMWLCYMTMTTLWILLLLALTLIGIVQAATQLQICHCEDGMHWPDGYSKICIFVGYFSCTLEGGQMGDNFVFFSEVLGLFLMFCLYFYYIIQIQAWRAVLRVHNVGIKHWDVCFRKTNTGSDRTPCMTAVLLGVGYLYPVELNPKD
jgi:hypothetical protein